MFGKLFLKLASWATAQALGKRRGTEALAHAAPVLGVIAQAANQAAAVRIDHAAGTGGNLSQVVDLVRAAQEAGVRL